MEQKSITALISAFSRAYHSENNKVKVFNDSVARRLFTDEEYGQISASMAAGIGFFNPSFNGNEAEALRWIVDNQLSPAPLGRSVFTEKALETAVKFGVKQYLIFAAGYDSFAYRQPTWAKDIQIYEIDHPDTASDKRERLQRAGIDIPDNVHYINADFTEENWQTALTHSGIFSGGNTCFCSMLGLIYYLPRQTFENMISTLNSVLPKNSSTVFDYPDEYSHTEKAGERAKKQAMMADAAKEKMFSGYSYPDMEKLLADRGFLIYEHLTPEIMTGQYFSAYNSLNPSHPMSAFDNVNYCQAVNYIGLL